MFGTTRVTCSWCHRLNVIGHGPTYCECGHNAVKARLDCDCPECSDARERAVRIVAGFRRLVADVKASEGQS